MRACSSATHAILMFHENGGLWTYAQNVPTSDELPEDPFSDDNFKSLSEELELESFYSITTFSGGMSPPLQIRQVARLRSTTSNLQVLSPTREEHTNNPFQKPNCRGHAVPAVSKFEPGQGIPPFSLISASTPAVLPAQPWWLLPHFAPITASTRPAFQLHLGLEVERLVQPSPLSPWQVPGQARARMQHKHKQARHEQAGYFREEAVVAAFRFAR